MGCHPINYGKAETGVKVPLGGRGVNRDSRLAASKPTVRGVSIDKIEPET